MCCFCWSGPLILDEALEVAKSVSNGDSNAVLFSLLPMLHASTDREIVKKNLRQLDDKIFGNLILISDRSFFYVYLHTHMMVNKDDGDSGRCYHFR